MTTPNLRERVARAIEESLYGTERIGRTDTLQYGLEADAAIAIVLEEAAKVCDEHAARYEEDMQICDDDGTLECVAAVLRGRAAAIRALKEKKDV